MNKYNGYMFFLNMFCVFAFILLTVKTCNKPDGNNITNHHLHNYTTLYSDTNITYNQVSNTFVKPPDQIYPTDSIIVPINVFVPADTAKIIAEWCKMYMYTDHYKDTLIDLSIFDTTYQNKIIGRSIKYTATIPHTTITNYMQRKWAFNIGVVGSVNNIGPSAIVQYKNISFQTSYLLLKQPLYSKFGNYSKLEFGIFKKIN